VPTVAAGKAGTPTASIFVTVRSDAGAVATLAAVSFTATENVYVPAVVGVPLSVPLPASSVIPGGREPVATENVYGGTPPDAPNRAGTIGIPAGTEARAGAEMVSGGTFTVRDSEPVVLVAPELSVAEIENVDVPVVVGVPEITPVAGPNESPEGRLPLARLQV